MLNKTAGSFGLQPRWLHNFPAVKEFIESYDMKQVHKSRMAAIVVYEVWGSDDIIGPLVDNDIARGYRKIPQDFKDFVKEQYNVDIETPCIFVKLSIDDNLKEMSLAREWRKMFMSATGEPLEDEHKGWEDWHQTFLKDWLDVPEDKVQELLFKEYEGTELTQEELSSTLPVTLDVDDKDDD